MCSFSPYVITDNAAVIGVVAAGRMLSLKTNEFKNVDLPHFICPITPMVSVSFSSFLLISSSEITFLVLTFPDSVSGIHPNSTALFASSVSFCFLL